MPQLSPEEIARLRGNQMDRGTGFAEQGGYQGGVYSTPMDQRQPMPVPPPRPPAVMPQGTPVPNPLGGGRAGRAYQLSPEEIQMYNRYMQEQELKRMYQQERLRGVLSGE
ncbi:MAG: hypothetical protein GY918_08370 [Gammaproteobacteria bacterium]|nr:hypothetical protein [Gammaproteobacteria bacterium]